MAKTSRNQLLLRGEYGGGMGGGVVTKASRNQLLLRGEDGCFRVRIQRGAGES